MCVGGFHWSHSCVSVRTLGTKPKLCSGKIYIPTKCPPVEFYRDFFKTQEQEPWENTSRSNLERKKNKKKAQLQPTKWIQQYLCCSLHGALIWNIQSNIMVKQLFLCDSEWFVWHLQSVVLSHTYWYILYGTLRRNLPRIYTNLFDSNQQYVGRRNKFSSKQQNGKFQDFFWKHWLQR